AGCLLIRAHFILFRTRDIRREQTAPGGIMNAALAAFALVYIHKEPLRAYFFLWRFFLRRFLRL
ncbi:hypothetical protein, partial [Muribaculum intestinale]|uniref:hypothetical protein n=1 Tax=Muribaculum intestinale TaxID=1796646 RepID=UPI0025A58EDD